MKSLFQPRLYWEGIKKIRVVGIASAILTFFCCWIAPIVHLFVSNYSATGYMEETMLSLPLLVLLPLSPFFAISMFSYLNERNKSDFYHAIPYTRQSVYCSSMSAILTWIWGIILTAGLTTCLLWRMRLGHIPFGTILLVMLAYALTTALIAAVMTCAMTLTGTGTSNLFVAVLLFLFFRVVALILTGFMEMLVPIYVSGSAMSAFLSPEFFLPWALLVNVFGSIDSLYTWPRLLYAVGCVLLFLVLGCFLYVRRRSESAGQSAPSARLQTVYRCAISFPLMLVIGALILSCIWGETDFSGAVLTTLLLLTLVVYLLYELITTKSIKKMLKSFSTIWILPLACLVVLSGMMIARGVILSRDYKTDRMQSVTLLDNYRYYGTYEDHQLKNLSVSDPRALDLVAEALADSIDAVRDRQFYDGYRIETVDDIDKYPVSTESDSHKYELHNYTRETIQITLKNVRTITRKLRLTEQAYAQLQTYALTGDEYRQAYLAMPKLGEIRDLTLYSRYSNVFIRSQMNKLWETFLEEYALLSEEQKMTVKDQPGENDLLLIVNGYVRSNYFRSEYAVNSALMPRTYALLLNAQKDAEADCWGDGGSSDFADYTNRKAAELLLSQLVKGQVPGLTDGNTENADYNFEILLSTADGYTGWLNAFYVFPSRYEAENATALVVAEKLLPIVEAVPGTYTAENLPKNPMFLEINYNFHRYDMTYGDRYADDKYVFQTWRAVLIVDCPEELLAELTALFEGWK